MAEESGVSPAGMHPRLGPGAKIAGYVIEEQVGAGGMAVVFRARDSVLGRLAALKVLSPTLAADPEYRARFLRETRLVAVVDEPHIVPVYAAGEAEGVLYIASRFVTGGDLARLVRRAGGPLAPARAGALIAQVAAALDAAHAAGLVHRDVKPGNVLVEHLPGRAEHAYLSDFGISKAASSVTGLTATGMFIGTPEYCSPEQVTDRGVDGRTDQYALACVAFNLLTGTVPYARSEPIAILFAHVHDPVPSLTARRPELPAPVDAVIARGMAKDPGHRYRSCGDFAAALAEALREEAPPSEAPVKEPPRDDAPREEARPPVVPPALVPLAVDSPSASRPVAVPPADPRPAASTATVPLAEPPPAVSVPSERPEPASVIPAPRVPPGLVQVPGAAEPQASEAASLRPESNAAPRSSTVAGATGPGTRAPRDPATVATAGGGPGTPRRRRKRAIIAGSAAAVLIGGGIAAAVALPGGGSTGAAGVAGSTGSAGICPQGSGGVGSVVGPAALQVPGGDCIIGSAAYSRDGTLLATPGGNEIDDVYLWNGVTNKFLRTLTVPSGTLLGYDALAFTPDDRTLTEADPSGDIYRWDLATGHGRLVASLSAQVDASGPENVAISGNATTLAVTDSKGDGVDIINAATGGITTDLTDPDSAPLLGVNSPSGQVPGTALSLSTDGSRLTVGDSTGNLYVWDVRGRKVIATLRYDPARTGTSEDAAATISGDGSLVAIPDGPSGLSDSLWDVASAANVTPRDARWPHGTGVTLIFSYSGRYIVTSESAYNHVDLWNTLTRAHVAAVDDSTLPVAAVSPDGKQILVLDGGDNPYAWRFP